MDINFTGFKNIGSISANLNDLMIVGKNELKITSSPGNRINAKILNIHLTDDYNGKDLAEFYKTAKKSSLNNYLNFVNKDFLNILFVKNNYERAAKGIFINNSPLELKDENLSFLSFLSKLLNRISETPSDKLIINKNYLESEDASKALVLMYDLKDVITKAFTPKSGNDIFKGIAKGIGNKNYDDFIKNAHSYDIVHSNVKNMFNILQDTMIDYFRVKS